LRVFSISLKPRRALAPSSGLRAHAEPTKLVWGIVMAQRLEELTPELQRALESAPVFFVATAPLSGDGHVNLSPKGMGTLRVLDSKRVAYLDLTGSGNETSAHVTENSRLTIMVCSFSGKPMILRVFCHGRVVSKMSDEWAGLEPLFPKLTGTRQIIVGEVEFAFTSCGYAVPEMTYVQDRDTLIRWCEGKGEDALRDYRRSHNTQSIDGVPAPETDAR